MFKFTSGLIGYAAHKKAALQAIKAKSDSARFKLAQDFFVALERVPASQLGEDEKSLLVQIFADYASSKRTELDPVVHERFITAACAIKFQVGMEAFFGLFGTVKEGLSLAGYVVEVEKLCVLPAPQVAESFAYVLPKTANPSLIVAGKEQQWEVADALIAKGADPLEADEQGYCYLYYVLRHGQVQRYQILAEKLSLDPNWECKGRSSLAIALKYGHLALVYVLEAAGATFKDLHTTKPMMHKRNQLRLTGHDIAWLRKTFIVNLREKHPAPYFTCEMKSALSWAGAYGNEYTLREILSHLQANKLAYLIDEGYGELGIRHPLLGPVIAGNQAAIEAIVAHSPNILKEVLRHTTVSDYQGKWRGHRAVHVAAEYGQIHLFEYLQKQGLDLCERKENYYNLWNWAGPNMAQQILLRNNDPEGLKELLRLIPFDKIGGELIDAVLGVARSGRLACWEVLKALPAEVLRKETWGLQYALTDVCSSGDQAQLDWLISLGAKPATVNADKYKTWNDFNRRQIPLDAAIRQNRKHIVETMLRHFSFTEDEQERATKIAIECRHVEMLRFLEESGFKRTAIYVEEKARTVLQGTIGDATRWTDWEALKLDLLLTMRAVKKDHKDSMDQFKQKMKELFDSHSEVKKTLFELDGRRQPLSHWAFEWQMDWVIPEVIFNDAVDEHGFTLWHKMAMLPEAKGLEWMQRSPKYFLPTYYSELTGSNEGVPNPLEMAFAHHNLWFFKEVFSAEKPLDFEQSWLHIAAKFGSVELAHFYLEKGLKIVALDRQRRTPLMIAAERGHVDVVHLLAQDHDGISRRDIFGNSALHYALLSGHREVALALIPLMSDGALRKKNRHGQSALQLAIDAGLIQIADESTPASKEELAAHFTAALAKVRSTVLSQDEKKMLTRVYQSSESTTDPERFIEMACELKAKVGMSVFLKLFAAKAGRKPQSIEHYLGIAEKLCLLVGAKLGFDLPTFMESTKALWVKGDLAALNQSLADTQKACFEVRYPKANLPELMHAFSTPNEFLKFPIAVAELEQVAREYTVFERYSESLLTCTMSDLQRRIAQVKKRLQLGDKKIPTELTDAHCELLALIAAVNRLHFVKFPYPTQVFAILAILKNPKGRVAQIRTGEGKTLTMADLTAFLGLLDIQVHVMTSSTGLAIRDFEESREFLALLGLTSFHVCDNRHEVTRYDYDVLYGAPADFSFIFEADALCKPGDEQMPAATAARPRYALIDEFDNKTIDEAGSSARMGVDSEDNHATWFYEPIMNYVKKHASVDEIMKKWEGTKDELIAELKVYNGGLYKDRPILRDMDLLASYLAMAVEICFSSERDINYVIEKDQVNIVDYTSTGEIKKDSRWGGGKHQLAEVANGLEAKAEGLTIALMSILSLLQHHYTVIYGVTGTMGSRVERQEISSMYGVDSFDVPTHRPCLRQTLPAQLCPSQGVYYRNVFQRLQAAVTAGRPVLLLFISIKDSLAFSEFLKAQGITHQLLNERQAESKEMILDRAGHSGMVTVATNIAARGTNIIMSAESLSAGGMRVILTFYPENQRIYEQAVGRAARQGQPGDAVMILSPDDLFISQLIPNAEARLRLAQMDPIFDYLEPMREIYVQMQSAARRQTMGKELVLFEVFQRFSKMFKTVYHQVMGIPFTVMAQRCQSLKVADLQPRPLTQRFVSLQEAALVLVQSQESGFKADWLVFFIRWQDLYFNILKQSWAGFLTRSERDRVMFLEANSDRDVYRAKLFELFHDWFLKGKNTKLLLGSPHKSFHLDLASLIGLPRDYFLRDTPQQKIPEYTQWNRELKSHYCEDYYQVSGVWQKKEPAPKTLVTAFDHYADNPDDSLQMGDLLYTHLDAEGHLFSISPRTLKMWDRKTGSLLKTLNLEAEEIAMGNFAVFGTYFACSSARFPHVMKIMSLETGECVHTLIGSPEAQIQQAAILPEGLLVTRDLAQDIRVWDIYTGKCVYEFHEEDHSESIAPLSATHFATVCSGKILVRDLSAAETGVCQQSLAGHTDHIHTLLGLEGDRLASSSYDGSMKVWDLESGECLHTMTGEQAEATCFTAVQGGLLASGHHGGDIKIWDPETGICLKTFKTQFSYISHLVTDGQYLVSSHQGSIRLWDMSYTQSSDRAKTVFFDSTGASEAPEVTKSGPQIDEID